MKAGEIVNNRDIVKNKCLKASTSSRRKADQKYEHRNIEWEQNTPEKVNRG